MSVIEMVAGNARYELARVAMKRATVAQHLGLTSRELGQRLKGSEPFTVHELVLLAQLLGIPLRRLLASVMEESSRAPRSS